MKRKHARMRGWTCVMVLSIGFISGGASCPRRDTTLVFPPPPAVLQETPELTEVVTAVNRTSTIRELSSNGVSVDVLSLPAAPKLSATISMRREREFRLRASLPLAMGTGMDLGSNSDLFWFEIPDRAGQTLYYARHDQYQRQLDRAVLPVDPSWIMDAFGLVQIDQSQVVAGPVLRQDGKLEVRSLLPMPAGTFQRVCLIDATAGHVTDQYLEDPTGRRIAESHASRHQYYQTHNCALPHTIRLKLLPVSDPPLELRIDVATYAINQILSGDPNLFMMPQSAGQMIDLTTLSGNPGNVAPIGRLPTQQNLSTGQPVSGVSYQGNQLGPLPYRGLVQTPR